jgi:imidazolonepropionase-like amidohydrolase
MEVCITMDHPVEPLQYLSAHAALAVKAGLDEQAALRAITINPAKLVGIDNRVGSLKVGKDADVCVYTGHPFLYTSQTAAVFVSGLLVKLLGVFAFFFW